MMWGGKLNVIIAHSIYKITARVNKIVYLGWIGNSNIHRLNTITIKS
jgi:hypothetical protein